MIVCNCPPIHKQFNDICVVAVCPEGHRTDLVAGCIICPADTYLDGDSCEACPATFSTNDEEGSTSVAACSYSKSR